MRNALLLPLITLIFLSACGTTRTPPPPLLPSAINPTNTGTANDPTATLTAEPTSIERGQAVTLKWSTRNAVIAELNQGMGQTDLIGTREVYPTRDTEYVLVAKNEIGEMALAKVMVTVRAPLDSDGGIPTQRPTTRTEYIDDLQGMLRDAYFDYDSSAIRADAEQALREDAELLQRLFQEFPSETVLVQGHCDQRGTSEYNLALGDRRAAAARDFLVTLGLPAPKLRAVSMGEEMPQCQEDSEACYQSNRRAHITLKP